MRKSEGFSLRKLKLAATGPVAKPITHELSGKRIIHLYSTQAKACAYQGFLKNITCLLLGNGISEPVMKKTYLLNKGGLHSSPAARRFWLALPFTRKRHLPMTKVGKVDAAKV